MSKETSRTFIYTKVFDRNWEKLGLTDDDLRKLELHIMEDSKGAPVIQGTGGIRKLRWSYDDMGKSKSIRVCYCDFDVHGVVYCIVVYAKKNKENLTKAERQALHKLVDEAKKNLAERSSI